MPAFAAEKRTVKAITPSKRTKLRRLPQRGHYDRATIDAVLDAGFVCHIGYVIDGQPYVTPTGYWREGDAVYWHGSAQSRMLLALAKGPEICLTVTHVDGLVVARSGFHKSVNYRSVMLLGRPYQVEDPAQKLAKMEAFVERLYPGRWRGLRPVTEQELRAMMVLGMQIGEASAKVRAGPPVDDAADYALPIWGGVIPFTYGVGAPQDDGRLARGAPPPPRVNL